MKSSAIASDRAMKSIPEMVREYLHESILNAVFLPGQVLKQDEVAKRMDVSRAPVREALNQLEREGLVVLRPRRGYVVTALDGEEIKEVFQMRMLLEEHAARMATERRTIDDIAAITSIMRKMDEINTCTPDDMHAFSKLDSAFHAALFGAGRQARLQHIISNLRDMVEHYVRLYAYTKDFSLAQLGTIRGEHREIFAAFEAGDADAAARHSRAHCQRISDRLLASFGLAQAEAAK